MGSAGRSRREEGATAHWRRPEAYLDPGVRQACSALAQSAPDVVARGIARLAADLESGRWYDENRELLSLAEWDAGFRLIVG